MLLHGKRRAKTPLSIRQVQHRRDAVKRLLLLSASLFSLVILSLASCTPPPAPAEHVVAYVPITVPQHDIPGALEKLSLLDEVKYYQPVLSKDEPGLYTAFCIVYAADEKALEELTEQTIPGILGTRALLSLKGLPGDPIRPPPLPPSVTYRFPATAYVLLAVQADQQVNVQTKLRDIKGVAYYQPVEAKGHVPYHLIAILQAQDEFALEKVYQEQIVALPSIQQSLFLKGLPASVTSVPPPRSP